MGHEFLVADVPDESFTDEFITGGAAAVGLLTMGTAAIVLLIRGWRGWMGCKMRLCDSRGGVYRGSSGCFTGATTSLPPLPTMAAVGNPAAALSWAFLFSAVTALAIRLAVQHANIDLDVAPQRPIRPPFLHERTSVGAVCLAGILSGIAANMWVNMQFMGTIPPIPSWFDVRYWWRLLNYLGESIPIDNPVKLLSIAAVLIRWLWRSFRAICAR
jgi:hypothetical protein